MSSFCLLASMEQIPIPNQSILHLHSSDTNSLKCILERKIVLAITIIVIKTHK